MACPRSPANSGTTARRSGSTSTGTGLPASRARTLDSFAPFAVYVRQRAADDPHLRSAGLHREASALGYPGSYSAFTRELRGHGITAGCETCRKWRPITQTPARERRPGPLPFRTAPVGGETIASYLARVAAASSLPVGTVTGCLPPWFAARAAACDDLAPTGQPRPADIGHLAALTRTSETVLRHALPALAGGGRPPVRSAPACRRCAARHGQSSPVPAHIPAHQRACQRHRTWPGRGTQIDITTAPEITAASRKASRLAREHGITRLVLAETTARQDTIGGPDARQRAAALALASPGLDPEHPDTAEAAAYPETIKIAAALLRTPGALPGGPE